MHDSKKSQEKYGADAVQICLGAPQRWDGTKLPKGDTASPVFVHAPYLINFSTCWDTVLGRSRANLTAQAEVASQIGASGLVVHGGSWKKGDRDKALRQWGEAMQYEYKTKILIENSANGQHSLTRYVRDIEDLWRHVGHWPDVGFCLDTCHLWASKTWKDHVSAVENILDVVGKIDLVHFNGSATEAGSGTDRHSALADSKAPPGWILEVAQVSGADTWIAETPDPVSDMAAMKAMRDG